MCLFKRKKKAPDPIVAGKHGKEQWILATCKDVSTLLGQAILNEMVATRRGAQHKWKYEKEMKEATNPVEIDGINEKYRSIFVQDISTKKDAERHIDFCKTALNSLLDMEEELQIGDPLSYKILQDVIKNNPGPITSECDDALAAQKEKEEFEKLIKEIEDFCADK